MSKYLALNPLFSPSSVAIIGASKDGAKSGGRFLKSFIDYGFKGRLYPINRDASEIMDMRAYPTILDIPGGVDLAILTIPAQAVAGAMAECVEKKVRFVIVHGAGFGEMGTAGREMEAEVLRIAKEGGLRFVGPNCMGICCPDAGINTITPEGDLTREGGHVAFTGQSGWVSENFIIAGSERGIRFSKVVSSGNQSDLDNADYLEYFGSDPKTQVIAAYVEGIKRGRRFFEVAREVSGRKPIIIWKAGRTQAGTMAVASHTGSLAGSDKVCDGAFKQMGILRAQNLDELIDFAAAFSCPPLPKGNRVGILVGAGGAGAAAADACESLGLEIPTLPEQIQQELKDFLRGEIPPFSGIANPVDLVWPPDSEAARIFTRCIEIMSPCVDSFLLLSYCPLTEEAFAEAMVRVRDAINKPVLVTPSYPSRQTKGIAFQTLKGAAAFPTPERASKALSALVHYSRYLTEIGEER